MRGAEEKGIEAESPPPGEQGGVENAAAERGYEASGPRPPMKRGGKPPAATKGQTTRRRFVWWSLVTFLGASTLACIRFFFPRALFEPSTKVRIGYPIDFYPGVDTRFQRDERIWVVKNAEGVFVVLAKCTHLGCTPNWIESEQKFKCPCHGSGFDSEGVNFEGPAPRPLDRCHITLDPGGQILVDKSRTFQSEEWERNKDQWLLRV